MKASDLRAKFHRDLSARQSAIAALNAERSGLALAAHSGDETAMLRVVEIRSELDDKAAGLKDLAQAIEDIEPAVRVEQAAERLRHREQLHGRYREVCTVVMTKMGAIDKAVTQLADAFRDAAAPLDQARHLAVQMMVPQSSDAGLMAVQRMIIANGLAIQSVADLLETALEDVHVLHRQTAPFPLRPDLKLSRNMAATLASVDLRVREAMRDDRQEAARAGVEVDSEAA